MLNVICLTKILIAILAIIQCPGYCYSESACVSAKLRVPLAFNNTENSDTEPAEPKKWFSLRDEIQRGPNNANGLKFTEYTPNLINFIIDFAGPDKAKQLRVVNKFGSVEASLTYLYIPEEHRLFLIEIKGSKKINDLGAVLILEAMARYQEAEEINFWPPISAQGLALIKELASYGLITAKISLEHKKGIIGAIQGFLLRCTEIKAQINRESLNGDRIRAGLDINPANSSI